MASLPTCLFSVINSRLLYLFRRLGEHPGFAGHAREVGALPVRKPIVSSRLIGRRLSYVVSDLDALLQDAAQVARTTAQVKTHISLQRGWHGDCAAWVDDRLNYPYRVPCT